MKLIIELDTDTSVENMKEFLDGIDINDEFIKSVSFVKEEEE